jgi:hypothetical protein
VTKGLARLAATEQMPLDEFSKPEGHSPLGLATSSQNLHTRISMSSDVRQSRQKGGSTRCSSWCVGATDEGAHADTARRTFGNIHLPCVGSHAQQKS